MSKLALGFLLGWAGSLLLTGIAAVLAHRRFLRLQERTRQAERLAELGTLTGGLAHEIKNPLSTVQLNLQLLAEDLDHNNPAFSRVNSRLNTVQRETTRLREILDDFLRYAGKLELDRKPYDLNILLEELTDFVSPQAALQRVQLRLKKADQPLIAPLDAKLIKQMVLNLMLNALQAMPDGGDLILQASRHDEEATIDVIDTGPGIAPDVVARIFDAYYSTKKSGTGLGLAIAKRVAEEHGGRLEVRSDPGKGTEFTIRLPLQIEPPASVERVG